MANKNAEASSSSSSSSQPQEQQQQQSLPHEQDQEQHGESCNLSSQPGTGDPRSRGGNTAFKSGPLSISSKGIGWTTWKKRWFILTRTSLVFFRTDPSAVQQRGSEVNLTLGGIDLNSSGSVVVKADKKLLTVLFPDGRDGRAFTLKADTMEDLYEWKTALESALTEAPSASHVMGQNGIFRNDHSDAPARSSVDEKKDETPAKSTVLGRPVLLALEDVDGSPSFLEKALRFVEDHGVKIEGILRQAADVDDVEFRIREYEQGKNEFTPGEDAHVIADCLKYFLRELPSSPVPASCCNALLDACRIDRGNRVNAMRAAICESFPEPNRRLLQRILMMMQIVSSNKNVNRMNTNAVAACMAPLLLRPLLAGDCEIENDFDVGGDGSMQLLQAAAAANHAQAIVITLLEEYDSIFGEGSLSPGLYSDSEESGSGTEEGSDDEEYDDDEDDGTQGSYYSSDEEEDLENESNGSYNGSVVTGDNHEDEVDPHGDHKINDKLSTESKSPKGSREPKKVTKKLSSNSRRSSLTRHNDTKRDENIAIKGGENREVKGPENVEVKAVVEVSENEDNNSSRSDMSSGNKKPTTLSDAPGGSKRNWGRTAGKKNLSMESIDFQAKVEVDVDADDADIERLQATKSELQNRVTEEVKNNAVLQASLERRKKALYGRREALEKDVERLQEQLQQEREKKSALEGGLKGNQPIPEKIDEKLKKDLQDVAQAETDISNLEHKVDDLENRLGQPKVKTSSSTNAKMKEKQKDASERSTPKDGQGRDEQDSQSKSSQQELPRGSTKLTGTSKRSSTKGEGSTTTTSALSKLTMRLNFLKERRSQIANELSNMDKGRSSTSSSSSGKPSPASGENQNRRLENVQEPERGTSSNQDPDNNNNNNNNNKQQSPHVLDRGRSENGGDKGRGSGGNNPNTTPRTLSR